MSDEWMFKTMTRRVLFVLMLPVVGPVVLALGLIVLFVYCPIVSLWCNLVRFASWLRYGDGYALGHLWWPTMTDAPSDHEIHKHMTREARRKLGLPLESRCDT